MKCVPAVKLPLPPVNHARAGVPGGGTITSVPPPAGKVYVPPGLEPIIVEYAPAPLSTWSACWAKRGVVNPTISVRYNTRSFMLVRKI
jgi:hypothetical protein